MNIDFEELRDDMKEECYGAYFGGGFGGALIESFDIDAASESELLDMAREKNIDIRKYIIP